MKDRAGAGHYYVPFLSGNYLKVARAWMCKPCHVSWYDGLGCPRCGKPGIPEPLPHNALLEKPTKPTAS